MRATIATAMRCRMSVYTWSWPPGTAIFCTVGALRGPADCIARLEDDLRNLGLPLNRGTIVSSASRQLCWPGDRWGSTFGQLRTLVFGLADIAPDLVLADEV